MAGVRRRLRDAVSGALGARLSDSPEPHAPAPHSEPEPEIMQTETVIPEAPVDAVLAAAVDLARAVAVEVAGTAVGEHLGALGEDADAGPAVTHAFATTDPAYRGWRWAVTVARAEGSDSVTVDEVVLLPGTDSLVAPAWVPWAERTKPEDLSPGDLLPPAENDWRLVPAYASDSDDQADLADQLWWELGLGREKVLSHDGLVEAAERWLEGETGPDAKMAKQAPGACGDCGFLVTLTGSLRQSFGVCANDRAPSDGRVVSLAHGCGAFSEQSIESAHAATAGMAVEAEDFEVLPSVDLL